MIFSLSLMIFPSFATADDYRLSLGTGVFGVLDSDTTGMVAAMLEGPMIQSIWGIRPTLLGFALERSSYYVGVGGHKEFALNADWRWGIASGFGYYHRGAKRHDLGYDLEFFSRISLSYWLSEKNALRAEFGHISNANLGKYNPGSETLTLSWVSRF